ncbi:MAG TPA: PIN domain-containing protein [Capsulimonadaceae bacterium]|jgi:hypothetical protein
MILIDTGPIVAMIDRSDEHFEATIKTILDVDDDFTTTEACLTEAIYLIGKSSGWPGVRLLRDAIVDGAIRVIATGDDWYVRSFRYMERFVDQPCDYADATLLVASEDTGIRQVLTLDRHFFAYRLASGEAINVLRP